MRKRVNYGPGITRRGNALYRNGVEFSTVLKPYSRGVNRNTAFKHPGWKYRETPQYKRWAKAYRNRKRK